MREAHCGDENATRTRERQIIRRLTPKQLMEKGIKRRVSSARESHREKNSGRKVPLSFAYLIVLRKLREKEGNSGSVQPNKRALALNRLSRLVVGANRR